MLRGSTLVPQIQLIGADEQDAGRLVEDGDEAAIITPLDERNLASADLVLLAGTPESTRKAWSLLARNRDTPVIDLTGTLEEIPASRLQAPLAGVQSAEAAPAVVAHPAAVALALFFRRLAAVQPVVRAVVEIFEPASERGQPGIDELHQQTMRLFAFQSLPKAVYDQQLAFAMLPRLGEDSPHNLEQIEATIERHLATLLDGSGASMPSLRLVQAPVFHGYGFSVWVEFAADFDVTNLETQLFADLIEVRDAEEEAPNNIAGAGQDGILVGNIRRDRNRAHACWFWIAADNLRLSASNAVRLAESLCAV